MPCRHREPNKEVLETYEVGDNSHAQIEKCVLCKVLVVYIIIDDEIYKAVDLETFVKNAYKIVSAVLP